MNRFLRKAFAVLPLSVCLLPGLLGCGPGAQDRAVVKGKVTIGGQALTGGTVTFTASDNRVGGATIQPDGTYTMGDAPRGEVTITVTVPQSSDRDKMMGMGKGMGGGVDDKTKQDMMKAPGGSDPKMPGLTMPGKVVPIPEKYSQVETSPLKYKVGRGEQTKDIDLTP